MFKAFKFNELDRLLNLLDSSVNVNYKKVGKQNFENHKNAIRTSIEKYYLDSKKQMLDGNEVMKEWFPQVKSHVFISHSHADIEKIYALAGYLKIEFGLEVFIDSCVWGYADELLRLIDNDHCYKTESQTYTYEKRNITTSNVYLMLLNSLQAMIDSTECVLFVETPNSVKKIPEQINDKTYSQWIFSELNIIDVIRIKIPNRPYETKFEKRAFNSVELNESLQVVYDITAQLNKLEELKFKDIIGWRKMDSNTTTYRAERNLDNLYRIKELVKV